MKKLLPHQAEDAAFLSSKRIAGCFSGMGSGKTLTALEAVKRVARNSIRSKVTTIIIGPPISLHMWALEFAHFVGGDALIVKTGKCILEPASAYVMSYEIATKRVEELKKLDAAVLICDESHALKSWGAKRTQAILGGEGLALYCDHSWFLTGTPETKWHDDLYPFLKMADIDGLEKRTGGSSVERFQLRYCVTQQRKFSPFQKVPTTLTVGNRNTEELRDWIFSGLAVRRELEDVWKDMPPITINRLQVDLEMTPELKRELKDIKSLTPRQLIDSIEDGQMASLRRMIGVAKVKHAAKEIVSRVEAGTRPILVGCWHREVIDAVQGALWEAGLTVGAIDGRTPGDVKPLIQNQFNDGTLDVLVGQISAMGVSLNMQGGSHIIVIEEDFSPAVMDQFYARCHRMGQRNHVHVDIFEDGTELGQAVSRIATAKSKEHRKVMAQ
ncbi:DEAD/DEAH box helicase [bacterium]|nr:DEAD/DEAH box helicase [bacterium]